MINFIVLRIQNTLFTMPVQAVVKMSIAAAIALAVFAFFPSFPVHQAEAASMRFTSDTTITTDQTISSSQEWRVDPGVTVTIAPGVTINVSGGDFRSFGTININAGAILNMGSASFVANGAIINNNGTINNTDGLFVNDKGAIVNNRLDGRINNFDDMFNDGRLDNDGTINNAGAFVNQCGAIFVNAGTYTGNPVNFRACHYDLHLNEDCSPPDNECYTPSNGVVDLNQIVGAMTATNDVSLDKVTITWINPDGVPVSTTEVAHPPPEIILMFAPDKVGEWTVEADFNNGVVLRKTLNISFMVIPESPIGAVAVVASSLAAIGGYTALKVRKR